MLVADTEGWTRGLFQCLLSPILISQVHCNFVPADASQHGHGHIVDEQRYDRPEDRISRTCGVSPSCANGPTNEKQNSREDGEIKGIGESNCHVHGMFLSFLEVWLTGQAV
jgi:hypothetical protein